MIGTRKTLVTFQREVETGKTDLNEPILVWSDVVSAFAKKTDVSDAEKIAAGEEASAIRARFVVPASLKTRGLTPADQIFSGARIWNIKGVKEVIQGGRDMVEITAVAKSS